MQKQLPIEWIEKIFQKMHGRFGNVFLDKYRVGQLEAGEDVGVVNAKQEWSIALGHLTAERLTKGLEAKYTNFNGPSCDEFKSACTPVPMCHRDNELLLPKPKPSKEAAKKGLQAMKDVLGMEATA